MATLNEYEDGDKKKLPPTTPEMKPYDAALDPSDPLRFLDKAFEFLAMESDMFEIDSLDKMEKVKIEGNGKAEKNTEKEVLPVKNEEMKEVAKSEIKVEEEKDGLRVLNKRNGLDMENYSWGQTSRYVDITSRFPSLLEQ